MKKTNCPTGMLLVDREKTAPIADRCPHCGTLSIFPEPHTLSCPLNERPKAVFVRYQLTDNLLTNLKNQIN